MPQSASDAVRRDHPRSRGVYRVRRVDDGHRPGSSPLARGLPRRAAVGHGGRGIIPARAGFTDTRTDTLEGAADHPRSRGVYPRRSRQRRLERGSSPLARGLLERHMGRGQRLRIIPARAGFTGTNQNDFRCETDHPRSRGVYRLRGVRRWQGDGSSPLARGLPFISRPRTILGGIIPARAGFTFGLQTVYILGEDHPRSRGVYGRTRPSTRAAAGSSPLARGLPTVAGRGVAHRRIIPARAGFTGPRRNPVRRLRDHPRSRGVYGSGRGRFPRRRGSSPLARGLRVGLPVRGGPHGIIPARAGFTPGASGNTPGRWDHPRSRGVYPVAAQDDHGCGGSSPLARGLRGLSQWPVCAGRIIPARAGFTCAPGNGESSRTDHPRSRGVYPDLR